MGGWVPKGIFVRKKKKKIVKHHLVNVTVNKVKIINNK